MEYIPQSESDVSTSGDVVVHEYVTTSEVMNMALIRIDGRYPSSGYTANTEVDALVQITDGTGIVITVGGKEFPISKGDQLHIMKGEAYSFQGNLELLYAASPKWTTSQTTHLD